MLSHSELRNADCGTRNETLEVRELKEPNWKFNREMYFKVGENWKWIDKRPWTDEQWKEYAANPYLRTFAGYCENALVGYFELHRTALEGQRFAGANSTAGGRESGSCRTSRPREAGDLVLVKTKKTEDSEQIEIAYFGLLPEFIGRGFGGGLLTSAIETAWTWAPTPSRVWVHTCNRDHPSALANYQARGFKIYKKVTSE